MNHERRLEPGTLELRTIDEALHGDVSKPLPRPANCPAFLDSAIATSLLSSAPVVAAQHSP